jgi:hypothetical protein
LMALRISYSENEVNKAASRTLTLIAVEFIAPT